MQRRKIKKRVNPMQGIPFDDPRYFGTDVEDSFNTLEQFKLARFFNRCFGPDENICLVLLGLQKPRRLVSTFGDIRRNWQQIAKFPKIYFGLNPSKDDLPTKGIIKLKSGLRTKSEITKIRLLLVDIDPLRESDVCSTVTEKKAAKLVVQKVKKYLVEKQRWPKPWINDSGNGYHLIFPCDLNVNDVELVKRVLIHLGDKFDTEMAKIDRTVFDLSRICRMPGFINGKGQNTAKRPHRRCRILQAPKTLEFLNRTHLEGLVGKVSQELNVNSVQLDDLDDCDPAPKSTVERAK